MVCRDWRSLVYTINLVRIAPADLDCEDHVEGSGKKKNSDDTLDVLYKYCKYSILRYVVYIPWHYLTIGFLYT